MPEQSSALPPCCRVRHESERGLFHTDNALQKDGTSESNGVTYRATLGVCSRLDVLDDRLSRNSSTTSAPPKTRMDCWKTRRRTMLPCTHNVESDNDRLREITNSPYLEHIPRNANQGSFVGMSSRLPMMGRTGGPGGSGRPRVRALHVARERRWSATNTTKPSKTAESRTDVSVDVAQLIMQGRAILCRLERVAVIYVVAHQTCASLQYCASF